MAGRLWVAVAFSLAVTHAQAQEQSLPIHAAPSRPVELSRRFPGMNRSNKPSRSFGAAHGAATPADREQNSAHAGRNQKRY